MVYFINYFIQKLIRHIGHLTFIVNIKKRETSFIECKMNYNTTATAFAFTFRDKTNANLPHSVIQLYSLPRFFNQQQKQLSEVVRQRTIAFLQTLECSLKTF